MPDTKIKVEGSDLNSTFMDLEKLFVLGTPVADLIVRSTVLYFGILFLIRVLPRRTGGELAMMDLIFILLIAEAASHALGDYTSLTDGFIAILALMGWNYLVNFLSYHFPTIERLVSAPPLQIVKDGRLLRRNMRREYLTEEELMEHLRKQGINDISDVKEAFVEGEGDITVVQKDRK